MNRILSLQSMAAVGSERVGADFMNAASSCSYAACGICSTESMGGCGPRPPAAVAI